MKIGAFIRSVGERTESLCFKSLETGLEHYNITLLRDYTPFPHAVKTMLKMSKNYKYDWFFGIDADVVMIEGWKKYLLEYMDHNSIKIDKCYRIDFLSKDRFVGYGKHIRRGMHFYNSKYIDKMLECLEETKNTSKPEGNIRNIIGVDEHKSSIVLGYHGFEQYHKDIFNRFILRAKRNPDFLRRFDVFSDDDTNNEEALVGKFGWHYGRTRRSNSLDLLDANKKIDLKKFGYNEIGELKLTLDEFYRKWEYK